jgi:hypothetical protein
VNLTICYLNYFLFVASKMTNYVLWAYTWAMGTLYPAYESFRAIETRDDPKDDEQWLTYWIVSSFWGLFTPICDRLLFWVPFYDYLTPLVITYLVHPQTRGASKIFNCFIKPLFHDFKDFEDGNVSKISELSKNEQLMFMAILKAKATCLGKMDDMLNNAQAFKRIATMCYPWLIYLKDTYLMNSSQLNIQDLFKKPQGQTSSKPQQETEKTRSMKTEDTCDKNCKCGNDCKCGDDCKCDSESEDEPIVISRKDSDSDIDSFIN